MAAGEEIGAGMTGEVDEGGSWWGGYFRGRRATWKLARPGRWRRCTSGWSGALETPEGRERDEENNLAWIFSCPMLSVRRAVTLHQTHHGAAFGIGSGRRKETYRYVPARLC